MNPDVIGRMIGRLAIGAAIGLLVANGSNTYLGWAAFLAMGVLKFAGR